MNTLISPSIPLTRPPITRSLVLSLMVVLAMAILLRFLLFYLDGVPFIYSDSGAYLTQSDNLIPAYDRPLGYAVLLKAIFTIHESLHTVVYIQTLLGVLMVIGFVWIARRYVMTTVAGLLLFAVLACLDIRTILFERWILSETLSMFLLFPYFLYLFRSIESGRWYYYLMTGALVSCLILTRTVFMFLIPFSLLVLAVFLPAHSRPKLVSRIRAVLLCGLGLLPLLLGYANYYHHHTGHFALTNFDGFVLWSTAADPSVCQTRPWRNSREIVCSSEYAKINSLAEFRDIWDQNGPVADLRRHYQNPILVNDSLRPLAVESLLQHPVSYLLQVVRIAGELFISKVSFAKRMPHQLQHNGANQVRLRFGSDHPSVSELQSTTWVSLLPLMRMSVITGALLLGASIAQFLPMLRRRHNVILLLWIWVYIAMVSMFGGDGGDANRFYVIITMPLLLTLVSTAESAWQVAKSKHALA